MAIVVLPRGQFTARDLIEPTKGASKDSYTRAERHKEVCACVCGCAAVRLNINHQRFIIFEQGSMELTG